MAKFYDFWQLPWPWIIIPTNVSTLILFTEMWIGGVVVILLGCLIWAYQTMKPPPSKICGTPNGPPITSPRIRLRDGRYLAYKARGSPIETARFNVILCHGFHASKETNIPLSNEWLKKRGICLVTFDRPGYSESDPNPTRSPKADAFDIQELADQLKLGSKFYIMGLSLGTYPIWGCLKYIPHRLAGVALVVPAINYWWSSLPVELCNKAFGELPLLQRLRVLASHYVPTAAWLFQKWLPVPPIGIVFEKNPQAFDESDLEIMKMESKTQAPDKDKILQQGVYESQYRDFAVFHGDWGFDPLKLSNPFPDSEACVHLWIGKQDKLMPPEMQREIARRLPWVNSHEVPGVGHLFIHDKAHCKTIFLDSLLLGQNNEPFSN